jgi:Protein of unknown function (DUF4238)
MGRHGKTKTHKAQHFVPQCYLRPWLDPTAPTGPKATPYVWVFDRDGGNPRRKAPANIFTETDLYTIHLPDGNRDLRLEHGLRGLEDRFTRVRNLTFARGGWPNAEQIAWLLVFVAAAQFRTVASRNHWSEQWGRLRGLGEQMQRSFEQASPKERERMARKSPLSVSARNVAPLDLDHVRQLEHEPIQSMIEHVVRIVHPLLARMSMAVLRTSDLLGFVTTDTPCTFCDPEAYKYPPFYRGPGLGVATTEVTMPLSPQQCLVITHRADLTGFHDVDERVVNEINRRHIAHCDQSFVARSSELRPEWFEQPPLPEDAWEKVRERKIASGEWPD